MSLLEAEQGESHGGQDAAVAAAVGRPLRVDAWRRFRKNKLAMVGLAFVVLLALVAIFAPWVAPYDNLERAGEPRQPPSWSHLFGTDTVGRDLFSRVVLGSRVSLRIGFLAAGLSLLVGVPFGAIAGYLGGLADVLIMRIVDVFLAIPYIILAVAIATALDERSIFGLVTIEGRSENGVIVIIGLTTWLGISRIVRASFLSLKQLEYVEAARALGFSNRRVMVRHILPNALQPIIVYGTVTIGSVILTEAALSFLGVGPQHPTPAWGRMISENKALITDAAHIPLFPGAAIFCTVLAFVFVGDGLRDALDPKLK